MPSSVIESDIDKEVDDDEAHRRYAQRVANWIVINAGEP